MKKAEQILDECTINSFDEIDKKTFIKAMKVYANQQLDRAVINVHKGKEEDTLHNIFKCKDVIK